jgi:hypothetical protein
MLPSPPPGPNRMAGTGFNMSVAQKKQESQGGSHRVQVACLRAWRLEPVETRAELVQPPRHTKLSP